MTTATATAALGKCVACSKVYRASSFISTFAGSCEECRVGTWAPRIRWARVRGTRGTQECDAACTSARGSECTCACGGDRHGSAWEQQW